MQVQSINSNSYKSYNSPNFGTMNVTEKGRKLLNKWWGNAPEYTDKIKSWEKELANTKYFNLEVNQVNNKLWMYISRKNPEYYSCEAPLYVFEKPNRNKLDVYGINIYDCGDYVSYPLVFSTNEAAKKAFNTLNTYKNNSKTQGNLPPFEQIHWAVDSVKILEQAFAYMTNPKIVKATTETTKVEKVVSASPKVEKLPFSQRLKNAWLALKGQSA